MSLDAQRNQKSGFVGCLTYLSIGISLVGMAYAGFSLWFPDPGVFALPATGFIIGVCALVYTRRSSGKYSRGATVSVLMAVLGLFVGWHVYLVGLRRVETSRDSSCINNLKQLACVLEMYGQRWDDHLPPGSRWNEALEGFVRSQRVWSCPKAGGEGLPSFAMNGRLSGMSLRKAESPKSTVLVFESIPGRNISGGPELLPNPPRHRSGHNIAFVDGHVETVPADRIGDLIWYPSAKQSKR